MDIISQFFNNNPSVGMIAYIAFIGAIFYFILIRPQRKKDKAFKEILSSIKVGDKITTIGGLYGKISKIKDDTIVIEMGTTEKTSIQLHKWAIKEVENKEKA